MGQYYIALIENSGSATMDWGRIPPDVAPHDRHRKLLERYVEQHGEDVPQGTYAVAQPNEAGLDMQLFKVGTPPEPKLEVTRVRIADVTEVPR